MCRILVAANIVLVCAMPLSGNLAAERMVVDAPATSASADGGWHPWYEIHIAPDNTKSVLICGTKWNAKENAPYGFVYHSDDGGRQWAQVLEDKDSAWVTEQSCAYGVHGVAYFVSDASKVIEGKLNHDLGTTRIFVSRDFGKTWKVGITTGWTDASTSAVDTTPGPDQNRLYVFFNALQPFYHSLGQKEAEETETKSLSSAGNTRVGMISYKTGDTKIVGPISSPEMMQKGYQGSYPAPTVLLNDGSLLTFYTTKRAERNEPRKFTVETVRTSPDRLSLEAPVKIADSLDGINDGYDHPCGIFYDTAGVYDAVQGRLYFVYPSISDKQCRLFLVTSMDSGKSWSRAQTILSPDETPTREYSALAIAVNKDGMLAVMWKDSSNSGCWMFAVSEDGGISMSRKRRLGTCDQEKRNSTMFSNAYLSTALYQADTIAKEGFRPGAARISLRDSWNVVWRNEDAIAVAEDGAFHPVWTDSGTGRGDIRTTEIRFTSSDMLIASGTRGLNDVTRSVSILYGGEQRYDSQSGTLTVDVVIRNKSEAAIHGPFKLAVSSIFKDSGYVQIVNSDNREVGPGAIWDFGTSVAGGTLGAESTSKPFALKFHYRRNEGQLWRSSEILDLDIKVFAGRQQLLEKR
jgi:hypothetical protein